MINCGEQKLRLETKDAFNYSGFASLEDLESQEWQELFKQLEKIQEEFLSHEQNFRSPEYIWIRDPLHNWSRVWEYPYVLYHLRKWRRTLGAGQNPAIIDFGSGVTFFPFAIAQEGFKVVAMDIDPICEKDFQRASQMVSASPGSVEFILSQEKSIPLQNNAVSAIYCISVLEHVADLPATISEIARVLEPKGLLILTVDLSLNGYHQLAPKGYQIFRKSLDQFFELRISEKTNHPCFYLLNTNGPFPMPQPKGMKKLRHLYQKVVRRIIYRLKEEPFSLACQGFVLSKK